jgi:4-carboxymuconolactone decarboxylase
MKNRKIISTAKASFGEFAPAFVEYTDNILFNDVWRRENLPLRERSLITIGALIAGEHTAQLTYHFKLAKENGISEEEIIEIITHLAFYVGWPRAAAAMQVAKEIFIEKLKK